MDLLREYWWLLIIVVVALAYPLILRGRSPRP